MNVVSVNQFRDNLKSFVEQSANNHEPLKVSRRNGEDFIVLSNEDWEREQETLYVLQNSILMKQIADSSQSHAERSGYQPNAGELHEILDL
jgi:antitoxin YefM